MVIARKCRPLRVSHAIQSMNKANHRSSHHTTGRRAFETLNVYMCGPSWYTGDMVATPLAIIALVPKTQASHVLKTSAARLGGYVCLRRTPLCDGKGKC